MLPANPERLKAFLADPARPKGTLRYHELQGFFFALACAPDFVRPSEWMPELFGGVEAEYASMDEAQTVLGALMALYNDVSAAVFSGKPALPQDCTFRRATLANLEDDAPVSEWARGFTRGHQWLEESWDGYIPEAFSEEFGAVLMTLSFFATRRLAERFVAETKRQDLPAFAKTIRRLFPEALASYAHFGRSIQQVLREIPPQVPRASAKAGRNDPCPCGSGRKYKKCCGATAP